jgi:hypothetical protein
MDVGNYIVRTTNCEAHDTTTFNYHKGLVVPHLRHLILCNDAIEPQNTIIWISEKIGIQVLELGFII